ncbi:plant UBX domain-containing protein 9 [Mercurialis annua]|uniref:plant UBX domain-containing protein 9 n=1 Tax=Mercurialis annua TaxID=3986 RepID=UPI00215DF16E|nr:plant UBX domain-containing protein 9 [Mercurialis annua]
MAGPTRDAIDTFMRVTGASESHAVQKLEEYELNLGEAINAHYSEVERHISTSVSVAFPQQGFVNTRIQTQNGSHGPSPFLSAARNFRLSSLVPNPNFRRNIVNQIGSSVFGRREPRYQHTGGDYNPGYGQPYHSGPMPAFDLADVSSLPHNYQSQDNLSREHEANLHSADIEEQMVQAAIENSKQEGISGLSRMHPNQEDDELAHAMSISLKTAEQEKAIRELTRQDRDQIVHSSNARRCQPGSSSFQGGAEKLQELSLWEGVSSKEIEEAILLEKAIFGKTLKEASYEHGPQPPSTPGKSKGQNSHQVAGNSSESLREKRLLREQQDDEYFTSLQADKEKERNTVKEPGSPDEMLIEEAVTECERLRAAKKALLPKEPTINDENAVTLLVRMPDGDRCSRRFLKSDKLKFLFDYMEVVRAVKPGTYRMVRPFPRRSFSEADSSLSLEELGLSNKQEALYLEFI